MIMMKAKCGHVEEKTYSDAHRGLCRKCHSNFAFLLELEQKYGEDALIEYWYAKILTYSSSEREEIELDCFIDHLIEFYQRNLIKFPSKEKYIKKMLYMLHSLQKPFDIETFR
ncbi:MAG: hypothetical protein ACJ71C_10085 [Nitrososphaeraceae archaeon]|jgi:hypothetical protein